MSTLLRQAISKILDDADAVAWDNEDPARYSRSVARDLAVGILEDAVNRARRALEMVALIEDDISRARLQSYAEGFSDGGLPDEATIRDDQTHE